MNMKKTLMAALLGAGTLVQAQTTNISSYVWNPTNTIPDGNPAGLTHQFTVTDGSIFDVQVSLDITGGFNGDLYAYLVSPQGLTAILLNRVGVTAGNSLGYANTGFNITLDALSGNDVHFYQNYSPTYNGSGQLTGTWLADGRNIAPNSAGSVFDSASTAANLGQYVNVAASGVWTLFIADLSGGSVATLNQATLTILTVPEPSTLALAGLGGLGLLALRFRAKK